jgi:hypothetical protein
LAKFNTLSTLLFQKEFPSPCTLLELDAVSKTIDEDTDIRNFTGQDGLVYNKRRLKIDLAFLNGLFMKIEQKEDYPG